MGVEVTSSWGVRLLPFCGRDKNLLGRAVVTFFARRKGAFEVDVNGEFFV